MNARLELSSIHSFIGNRKSKVEREEVLGWFGKSHKASEKEFWLFHNQGWDSEDLVFYLPIQNLLKIFPNKSSVVICPVISPS
ncbi:MAG: hypothetical protein ACI85I_001588 [Arenicella sp.]|jgi:hypothetical protein